ncbi:MAG TPA: catalase [Methylomirabilota bacterium]|nr:catalase [Methylomirabilota bacterium]
MDALQALFGVHPGYRAVHAKGIVCEGTFSPAPTAASVSRAPHLQDVSVPTTVRFSDFAGVPTVPDGDPLASPRGMAIKFHLPGGIDTDVVAQSYDGFPVRTAEEFLVFVRALATSGPPLADFLASHPQAKRFAEAPKPVPASFATESYYGVNAFRFTNREGVSRAGRYRIRPEAGEEHLDAAEAARRPGNFLFEELRERLFRGPARFRLLVQLADDGDPIDDGSLPWPEGRRQVELGTIVVTAPLADSAAVERRLLFDPARLVDGIGLSEDPLPLARSAVYAIAYRRRNEAVHLEVTGVHLCCQGCVDAVDAAVKSVAGATSRCDIEKQTVALTARDGAAAQKALDAVAAAGFHGRTDDAHLAMKAVSRIPRGRVKYLKVSGIHNCCDLCCEAIKGAIATVDGVADDTATPGATAFEVTGDFQAAALVKALNTAGFGAKVKR